MYIGYARAWCVIAPPGSTGCGVCFREFGIVMPKGRYAVQSAIPAILGDPDNGLPRAGPSDDSRSVAEHPTGERADTGYDQWRWQSRLAREDETAKRLLTIPGCR